MAKTERREAHTLEDAVEAGLLGVEVDPTPNEHYTVAGVVAGKPTPETDPDAAAAAGATFGRAAEPPAGTRRSSGGRPNAREAIRTIGDRSDDELAELANDNRSTVSEAAKAEQARRAAGGGS